MTNFNKNIDYLLSSKLQNFEQEPAGFMMNKIFDEIDKEEILSQFETSPPAFVFDNVFESITNPNFDDLLAQKVENFEPKAPTFKPKRKLLPYLYLVFLTTFALTSIYLSKSNPISGSNISKTFSNKFITQNIDKISPSNKSKDIFVDINKSTNLDVNRPFSSRKFKKLITNLPLTNNLITDLANNMSEDFHNFKRNNLGLLAINFNKKEIENLNLNFSNPKTKRNHLFFVGIDVGTSFVGSFSQKLDNDFVHQDALKLLKQTVGINHVANFAQINLGYEKEKWRHQFGVLYQVSNYSSQFEYYFTHIPIYSATTGKVITYFERPQHLSPYYFKSIKNHRAMISTQLVLSRHIKTIKKWNLWVEVGANLVILNKQKGEVFDFSKGNLKTFEENVKFKLNNTQFITNINFERKISFNNLLKFQIGLQQSSHKLNFYKVPYTQKQIIGQIKTGWIHYF